MSRPVSTPVTLSAGRLEVRGEKDRLEQSVQFFCAKQCWVAFYFKREGKDFTELWVGCFIIKWREVLQATCSNWSWAFMCLGCQQLLLSQPILTTIIRIPGRRRNVSDTADMSLKSYHAVLDNADIGFLTSSALQFFPPAVESRDESPNIRNPWAVSSAKQRPGDTIKHPLSFKRSRTRTKRGGNTRGKMVFLLWKKNTGIVSTLLFHASLATLYRVVAILFKDKSEMWDSALPAGQKPNFLPLADQSRPWWPPANIHKEPYLHLQVHNFTRVDFPKEMTASPSQPPLYFLTIQGRCRLFQKAPWNLTPPPCP